MLLTSSSSLLTFRRGLAPLFGFFFDSNAFQNLRFSSLATLATVWPSGEIAVCRTRESWPGKSTILLREGYDHRLRWLLGKPCEVRNSLYSRDHTIDVTCEPVSTEAILLLVEVFQKCTCRSADPPPVDSTLICHGHHASAF